jgi:ABC-type transport system substrate-binding protein
MSDPKSDTSDSTRRNVLRGIGAGSLTTLAGCGASNNSNDGGGSSGNGSGGNGGGSQGDVVQFELMTGAQQARPLLFEAQELIAQEFGNIGVQVELNGLAIQQTVERAVVQGDYDVLGISFSDSISRLIDPDTLLSQLLGDGQLNISRYQNQEFWTR